MGAWVDAPPMTCARLPTHQACANLAKLVPDVITSGIGHLSLVAITRAPAAALALFLLRMSIPIVVTFGMVPHLPLADRALGGQRYQSC